MTTNQKDTGLVRELSLEIIIDVLEKGGYSHKVIGTTLTNYQYLPKQDRAFLTRLCEGTIEHAIELDYIINQVSSVKVKKMKPVIRNILRMGVYQIKYMNQVPDSAACNESVKLAKKKGFKTLTGFVNGVLRNVSRTMKEIKYPNPTKNPAFYLSIVYSVPEWIVTKWIEEYGFDVTEGILKGSLEEKKTTIRVNQSKITKEALKERLVQEGVQVEEGSYANEALKISGYNYLNQLESFQSGLFQVQDESSMLVGMIAGVKEGDTILDVCAAPGGKSLHVADLLHGTGLVSSRDLTEEKVFLVEENKKRLGVSNMETKVWDARVLDEAYIGKADIVIADVPCSGLGVFGKKSDIKYKMSEEQQKELVVLQREILDTVSQYVKEDGILIYSTCTIHKGENEENVDYLLERGFVLESIDEYLPASLHSETTKLGYLQLIPGKHDTDGFFLARLRKGN